MSVPDEHGVHVTAEDVDQLPSSHRRIVAQWLTQQATALDADSAARLRTFAADLLHPLRSDRSPQHTDRALDALGQDGHTSTACHPATLLHLGDSAFIELRYFSTLLDETYHLRAALAHEAQVRATDLTRSTYPVGRRRAGEDAITRMRAAARGEVTTAYTPDVINNQEALRTAGADGCLTTGDWIRHVDNPRGPTRTQPGT